MKFATKAIHAGQPPDPSTNAVITPIFQTTTYAQEELGKHKGFSYSRVSNPTRKAMEENIAALEGGAYALSFSSGLAAIHAVASVMTNGDHILISENTYGGTFRLFDKIISQYGIKHSFFDPLNLDELDKKILPETKMVFTESPTNPLMIITDLRKVSEICKRHNVLHVTDNTFMSPYFQKPLSLGCDIVVHSTTKYLNGHSDVIGGVVVLNDEEVYKKIKFTQYALGAIPSPFDSWLVLRSTKTLAVRMKQHNENAIIIAGFLQKYSNVKAVHYPGLPDHPQHELAKQQMSGFGGMLSFDLGSLEKATKFLNSLKIFTTAESLGGVESLAAHPVTMTHASVPKEERDRLGITDGLVRLSVGIEDIEDLIDDLKMALEAV
jgi:cystathionine beta-lyase/cystathionine gamma-synthase